MARRLLVIEFTRFASDLWLRKRPLPGPFALIARLGNSDRLSCVNEAASALGLVPEMTLADARAVYPDLITAPADPVAAASGLARLRRWTMRYAPQVGFDGPRGLVADITGVAHLFGGEAELRDDLHARIARAGFHLRSAIAPTRGAAWALSRHGGGIIAEGAISERLAPLPLSALRLEGEIVEGLARLGLQSIGELMVQPRAPLARRFGADLLRRLDQALGTLPEPVAAVSEAPGFSVRMSLPEPIGKTEDVMAGLRRLLDQLCQKLTLARMGARRLRFELGRVDKETVRLEIGLARPMRDPERIARLFAKHVEAADAGYGIERLRLEAVLAEPLAPTQIGNQEARAEDDLADLITRLGNRLGFETILRAFPREGSLPEKSFILRPAAWHAPVPMPPCQGPSRPIRLFRPEALLSVSGHPPARFRWRGMGFTTLRAQGPERIAPDWWQTDPDWATGLRDYWKIHTHEGPRLWLFHTPQAPAWHMAGEFI